MDLKYFNKKNKPDFNFILPKIQRYITTQNTPQAHSQYIRSPSKMQHQTYLSSLSLIPGQGWVTTQSIPVAPEVSQICCKAVSWPRVPPGPIVD